MSSGHALNSVQRWQIRSPVTVALIAILTVAQILVWLLSRPDLYGGPEWTAGSRLELWIGVSGGLAVGVGAISRRFILTTGSVTTAWIVQMMHFALFGEHHDSSLWAVGLFVQAVIGGTCLALATASQALFHRPWTW